MVSTTRYGVMGLGSRSNHGSKHSSNHGSHKKPESLQAMQDRALMPPPRPPTNSKARFAKYPQWYAVNKRPPPRADPHGYLKMIPHAALYQKYATVMGLQPWVVRKIKKYLHLRYWDKNGLANYNYRRQETSDALTDELNIGLRNYATRLTNQLRYDRTPEDDVPRKTKTYDALMALSDAVYRMGSHKVSGYFLYKIGEGLMREMIKERKKVDVVLKKIENEKRKLELEKKKKREARYRKRFPMDFKEFMGAPGHHEVIDLTIPGVSHRQVIDLTVPGAVHRQVIDLTVPGPVRRRFPRLTVPWHRQFRDGRLIDPSRLQAVDLTMSDVADDEVVDRTVPDAADDDTIDMQFDEETQYNDSPTDDSDSDTTMSFVSAQEVIDRDATESAESIELAEPTESESESENSDFDIIKEPGKRSLVVVLKVGKRNLRKLVDKMNLPKPKPKVRAVKKKVRLRLPPGFKRRTSARIKAGKIKAKSAKSKGARTKKEVKSLIVKLKLGKRNLGRATGK
ncbi:hypothetical protein TWF696_008610 [Orbilia brochopaga]|uniref:Uncharacterized protein n=1 Tax=Orbilia brochopaga TaxID=3140254 RepID=A0AAV9ULY7_9PEZI